MVNDSFAFINQTLGGENVVQRHEQTTGDQGRQYGHENVRNSLDKAGEDVSTGFSLRLSLILRDLAYSPVFN